MVTQSSTKVLRRRDAIAKSLRLSNRLAPSHFCLAAEITGRTTVDTWLEALQTVGRRSSLASVKIHIDDDGETFFSHGQPRAIPLKVVRASLEEWQEYVSDELSTRFDITGAPLARAVLLHKADRCVLILTLHHLIADAASAQMLLHDLMRAAGGAELKPDDRAEYVELSPATAGLRPLDSELRHHLVQQLLTQGIAGSHETATITSATLSEGDTMALQLSANFEGATIHGAVCAAAALAYRDDQGNPDAEPPGVFTPVTGHSRLLVGAGHLGVHLSGITTKLDVSESSFWEDAKEFSRQLAALNDLNALTNTALDVQSATSTSTSPVANEAVLKAALQAEICVVSLEAVAVGDTQMTLTLENLWGPAMSRGANNEHALGVSLINGKLHLLHTAFAPAPGFLVRMLSALKSSALD